MRVFSTLLVAIPLVVTGTSAGVGVHSVRGAASPRTDNGESVSVSPARQGVGVRSPLDNSSINWVIVDSMANAFGPANSGSKPIVYDPGTGVVAVIHRGASPYALGSGQLWYNISHDGGTTWRRVSELNSGNPNNLRYPSASIMNASSSSDTGDALLVWGAPNLDGPGGTFGGSTYGVDAPLGGASPFAAVDDGPDTLLGSNMSVWTAPGSPWIYWATTDRDPVTTTRGDFHLWRTTDYITVNSVIPATWNDITPNFENALGYIVGKGTSNAVYFAVHGLFGGDTSALAFNGGYSKSTDNGVTWSDWSRPRPDWMAATGLDPRYDLMDYVQPPGGTVAYTSDFAVDANERGHFVHAVVDSPWLGDSERGLLEIYETGTGWGYKWITQAMNELTRLDYPDPAGTLDQTRNAPQLSVSEDGQVLALLWVDGASTAATDTLTDIWFSYRKIDAANWSTPENLTNTPNLAELLLHQSPVFKSNGGGSYTLFLGRSYQIGDPSYPNLFNTAKTNFYLGTHTFSVTGTGVDDTYLPAQFEVRQNYPNPFNPSTRISYVLPARTEVRVSVFNILGQEVAALVNEVQEEGVHSVDFAGTSLSSGVYLYRVSAGEDVQTRRMLLLK